MSTTSLSIVKHHRTSDPLAQLLWPFYVVVLLLFPPFFRKYRKSIHTFFLFVHYKVISKVKSNYNLPFTLFSPSRNNNFRYIIIATHWSLGQQRATRGQRWERRMTRRKNSFLCVDFLHSLSLVINCFELELIFPSFFFIAFFVCYPSTPPTRRRRNRFRRR